MSFLLRPSEIEDGDIFDGENVKYGPNGGGKPLQSKDQKSLRIINKKAELQYTNNIEEIIKDHVDRGVPLDVTHAVSLQEVKRNLSAWKSSALKEYTNLRDSKRAFEVRKKHELPPQCRIVPCKGVYTVKPCKDNLFRRKTRFVACGNHVPEGQEGMELFAAGLDATTLRTMLAYTIDKGWACIRHYRHQTSICPGPVVGTSRGFATSCDCLRAWIGRTRRLLVRADVNLRTT